MPQPNRRATTKQTVKIGRPGYKVTKQYDPETMQRSLLFQVQMQSCLEHAFHFFALTGSGIIRSDSCTMLALGISLLALSSSYTLAERAFTDWQRCISIASGQCRLRGLDAVTFL